MCGRYTLFTDTEAREIREIIEAAQRQAGSAPLKTGEIFPTNLAPILTCSRQRIQAEAAVWGFPGFQGVGGARSRAPLHHIQVRRIPQWQRKLPR